MNVNDYVIRKVNVGGGVVVNIGGSSYFACLGMTVRGKVIVSDTALVNCFGDVDIIGDGEITILDSSELRVREA